MQQMITCFDWTLTILAELSKQSLRNASSKFRCKNDATAPYPGKTSINKKMNLWKPVYEVKLNR